jgi:hypothetical protein
MSRRFLNIIADEIDTSFNRRFFSLALNNILVETASPSSNKFSLVTA